MPGRPIDDRVMKALTAMLGRPEHRWTVRALARVAGLSRAAFARRFATEVGAPPLTYLTELRLNRAAKRLTDSDASLAELAEELGYATPFALSRAFKRRYDVAPSRFRRAAGEAPSAASNGRVRGTLAA
ncbi:MAG: helix-turn-helix transcriptional regulator [Polyangiaceae bacterium]